MRAVVIDAIGDRGRVADVPEPEPGPGEVLVRVGAVGLIASDWRVRGGSRFPRQEHRFPAILGFDFAGAIERADAAGRWAPGQRVFGIAHKAFIGAGCLADYVAMPADGPMAATPERFDDVEASALVSGWLTSRATLDEAGVVSGAAVALLGASGGVGSVLTQLLAAAGAHVIAVTRAANERYVRDRGAADVVPHDRTDRVAALRRIRPDGIDVLIDLVSDRQRFAELAGTVRNGGLAMSGIAAADAGALEAAGRRGVNIATKPAAVTLESLDAVWAELALMLPDIRVLSLDGAVDAIDELERGHVRGKLVVELAKTVPG